MSEAAEQEAVESAPAEPESVELEQAAVPAARIIRAPEVVAEQVRPIFASPKVRVIDARVVDSLLQLEIDFDEARREAAEVVEAARAEADAVREAARSQGHQAGFEEVLEHLARARTEYADALEAAEGDMVEMAFRLAGRIIGETVELEPARVQKMVAGVLRHARGKRDIVVAVCPDDLPMLEDASATLAQQVDGVPVYFEADAQLSRGSCVIQTESGRIDGRIETQLDTLKRALQGG